MQKFLNLIALICILAVGFALFSQPVLDMRPCAWCVFQRLIFLAIAAVCLLGNLVSANIVKRFIAFIVFVLGIGGMLSAWYQYDVAAQMFSCDMTLADRVIAKHLALDSAIPWLFGIYATCMDAAVDLFGIEYALWALALFALITIAAVVLLLKKNPERQYIFHQG